MMWGTRSFATAVALVCVCGPVFLAAGGQRSAIRALDADRSASILEKASTLPRLRSLLVSIDGELVEEHYFNGATRQRPANLKSASKTVLSILVGILIDQELLTGVDQSIVDFFPVDLEEASAQKRSITIGDLLSMRSGLQTTSNRNYGRWVQSSNWVRHILSRPMVDVPGGRMVYSTGSTHLLSAIITRVSGMTTLDFGRRHLAEPLGISLPAWPRDPQGVYFGGNDMLLTPRAMVAIGELYRSGGVAGGAKLVSAEWIRESWVPRTVSRYSRRQYGYGWWMRLLNGYPTYYAWGYGGQYIYVIPELESVIAVTSSPNPGDGRRQHRRDLDEIIERQLIPAIRDQRGSPVTETGGG